jgi:hypothetical protein
LAMSTIGIIWPWARKGKKNMCKVWYSLPISYWLVEQNKLGMVLCPNWKGMEFSLGYKIYSRVILL